MLSTQGINVIWWSLCPGSWVQMKAWACISNVKVARLTGGASTLTAGHQDCKGWALQSFARCSPTTLCYGDWFPPHISESRIFWSRIGGNCDKFSKIILKIIKIYWHQVRVWDFYHQINDHNYFIIFNFFFYLFLNVCLIIYKLYFANFSQHFFFYYNFYPNKWCHFYYKVYGNCLFIVKCIRTYFNCFEYKLYNDCLHMLKGIKTYICCHKN